MQRHYDFAKQLNILRNQGVLIIGSGNIVHNLYRINWQNNVQNSWAVEFNEAVKKALLTRNHEAILNYKNFKGAAESVPTSEHFLPLIYILALQECDEDLKIFNDGIELGSIAITSFVIASTNAT